MKQPGRPDETAIVDEVGRNCPAFALPLIGTAILSPAKRCLEVNGRLCEILGYSREELARMAWPEVTHPDDLAENDEYFNRALAGGIDAYTLQKRFIHKDGAIVHARVCVRCVRQTAGEVEQFIELIEDISEQKQTERALRMTQFAIDHCSYAIYWVRADGRIHYVNEAACRALEYSFDELVTMSVPDIDPDFPFESWPEHWSDMKRAGSMTFEAHHRTKQGRVFPVEITSNFVEFEGREYIWAYVLDITERMQTELALRESEKRVRLTINATSDGGWDWNVATGEVFYSDRWIESLGYDRSEVPAHISFWQSIVHPDDMPRVREVLKTHFEGCTDSYECENRLRTKSGDYRWNLDRGQVVERDGVGSPRRMVGTDTDITERKRTEAEMNAVVAATSDAVGVEFFRSLVRNLATALDVRCALVGELLVSERNETVRTLAVWTGGDFAENFEYPLRGTPCENLGGHKVFCHAKNLPQLYPDSAVWNRLQVESYLGVRLSDSSGEWIGGLAVMNDAPLERAQRVERILTIFAARAAAELERLRMEKRVRQQEAELAHLARVSTLGELTSGLAHELNQPLAAIGYHTRACLNRLRSESVDHDRLTFNLEQITTQSHRAGEIIRRLRSFVRRRPPRRSSHDLKKLIEESVGLVEPELKAARVRVRFELGENAPLVLCDGVQVQQVILNLLQNGLEAMKETDLAARELLIRTAPAAEGAIEVSIGDRGCGLPPDRLRQVFEPFFTTKRDGLGMGLAISRTIIDAHGGRLWAAPNSGGGTVFHFSIPTSGVTTDDRLRPDRVHCG